MFVILNLNALFALMNVCTCFHLSILHDELSVDNLIVVMNLEVTGPDAPEVCYVIVLMVHEGTLVKTRMFRVMIINRSFYGSI